MRAEVDRPVSTPVLPAVAVALCGLIWGGFWYPLRWLNESGVSSIWVSLLFNTVATVVALPCILPRRVRRNGSLGQLFTGLLLGTAFSLYTVSLVMTDVIHAILLFYLTPVWSTLAGFLFLGEKLTTARLAALALGLAGMLAILGVGEGIPVPRNAGDWIALLSGICWAAGTLRSYHRPARGIAIPAFSFALGGLVSSGIIMAVASLVDPQLTNPERIVQALPWIVGLALVIFVPPNFLVLWAAQRIHPARVGILLMTEVLGGAVTAALFSGEAFGPSEMVGTAMIACAGLMEVTGRQP